jgi:ABC-2 type transport system ATP-binding protein
MDEPTTGLDPQGRRLVADLILEQKARGTAVLLSSHILSDVERTCDQVVMIRDGSPVLSGSVAELVRGTDEWDIEMLGASDDAVHELEQAGYAPVDKSGGAYQIRCDSATKASVLRLLLDLSVDIGSVRRVGNSLEDLYLRHVGVAPHE